MKTYWQKVFFKITVWLITEILLNILGLDNLADYSEFVFEGKAMANNCYIPEVTLENWV